MYIERLGILPGREILAYLVKGSPFNTQYYRNQMMV